MPSLADKLRRLWPCSRADKIDALFATLPHAGVDELPEIVSQLLALAHGEYRPGVLRHLMLLAEQRDEPAQRAIFDAGAEHWEEIVRPMLSAPDVTSRLGAIELIGRAPLLSALNTLADRLADPERAVGDAAQEALGVLTERAISADGPERARILARLVPALERAIGAFEQHRREGVFGWLLSLTGGVGEDRGAGGARGLAGLLNDDRHPVHLFLRAAVRREGGVAGAPAAWVLLGYSAQRSAALDRVLSVRSADEARAIWSRWHLLLAEARRRALRTSRRSTGWPREGRVINPIALAQLPERARVGGVKILCEMSMDESPRDRVLGAFLGDVAPGVRHAMLRAGDRLRTPPGVLTDLCFDPDPRVSLSASTRLLGVAARGTPPVERRALERLARSLVRSPHEQVRTLARAYLQRADHGVRAPGVGELRAYIEHGGDTALARQAASGARFLRADTDAAERAVLLDALRCGEQRVRASAAEALGRALRRRALGAMGPDQAIGQTLLELLGDDCPRVRANVCRALLLTGGAYAEPARAGLLAMLGDARAPHRISALWAVTRSAARLGEDIEIMDRAGELARRAAGESERVWGERCVESLHTALREGWESRAASIEPGEQEPPVREAAA